MSLAQTELDSLEPLLDPELYNSLVYSVPEIALNTALAILLGLAIASLYKATHKGLDYEQHMTQTLVIATVIVALILMTIGSNPVRAFALVGTVSIIRFRTGVKDPRDTSFVFASLALGMAAGTSSYLLAGLGFASFAILTWYLWASNFGYLDTKQFLVRFVVDKSVDQAPYQAVLGSSAQRATLLNENPTDDGDKTTLIYDIQLEAEGQAKSFLGVLKRAVGVSKVALIQSRRIGGL